MESNADTLTNYNTNTLHMTAPDALVQGLLNASRDVMCCLDEEGRIIYTNKACTTILGYKPEELTGYYFIDLISPEDRVKTTETFFVIKAGEEIPLIKNSVQTKDGPVINMVWQVQWDVCNNVFYCTGKLTKNKSRSKEKEIQKKLIRAYKLEQVGWWELDSENNCLKVSSELFALYGLEKGDNNCMDLEVFLSMVHPDDVDQLKNHFKHIKMKTSSHYEHRLIKPNGELIYVAHYIDIIRNRQGEILQIHGTTKNITQNKIAQLALAASEKKANEHSLQLEETLDNLGSSFITMDQNWAITFWNKRTEMFTSISKAQALGKSFWDIFPKAISLKFYNYFLHAVNHQVPVHFEEYSPTFDLWLEVKAFPTANGLSVYIKSLNAQKKQEEELKISNERFQLAAQATSDTLWDWDLETHQCYINESFTNIYGHTYTLDNAKEVWQANLHPNDKKRIIASLVKAINDKQVSVWQQDYQFLRIDGSVAFVHDRGTILRNDEGTAIRMVGAMRDQTEKVQLEKLIAEEKVETQKQISKTIIQTQEKERSIIGKELHDNVNQILTTAKLYVENVIYYPDKQKLFIDKAIDLIQKGITEIRYLSKTLITPTLADIGFEASMQELIEYYKQLKTFDIELGFGFSEKMIEKELKLSVYRILQELLNNTVKYAKATRVSINFNKDERYLTILYKDNGVGFDPSLKKDGVGLSNIKNRVELFKGKMRMSTGVGKGLSVMIVFPYQ